MLSIAALVAAGVSLLVVVGDKLAKRTKTKKDDKLVDFVEDNAEAIVKLVLKLLAEKGIKDPAALPPAERPRVVDHRK